MILLFMLIAYMLPNDLPAVADLVVTLSLTARSFRFSITKQVDRLNVEGFLPHTESVIGYRRSWRGGFGDLNPNRGGSGPEIRLEQFDDCCNNNNILEQEGAVLTGKVDYMFDASETWWLARHRTSTQCIVLYDDCVSDVRCKRIKLADPSIEYLQVLVKSSANVNAGLISAARHLWNPYSGPLRLQSYKQYY
ncbi:uncharacterized protein HD556DRAFT_1304369 [Suillus plorans]|uniref:Uncharacterized protein n=1 Tax=Suillus plorans TaxID=116603 RepID=A0A9P7DSZ0_9AGAM|nr:uncharacterized protein HD556DRAFT_1304369 [Suillus plorans]KAG1802211.1 hypothetical protein HD556DRAFT_1304369 [Suillus plorans]